ncbi:methyltransferase family protein [Dyella amyloliquefaciens]|uniref:methyltransferase family protein n=1 Tax=Dyella amyloliquefaciens TaxID=1770545 RepID=UPI00102E6F29|nr:isoprenylcysteine carboxylmethyltransferase family protein [Dyella amyloliquefaciens]
MTTLSLQAWRNNLRSVLFLGVLLFACAWTLRYWQAWLYVGIYGMAVCFNTACFLKRDPSLVERRLQAGPGAETTPNQRRIQAAAAICLLGIFVLAGLDHRWSWSSVPPSVVLAGDGLLVEGLVLVFVTFRHNSYAASTVEVVQKQTVAADGPYAWVRHPMYLGSGVAFLATPAALGSTWAWLAAVPATLTLAVRLVDEERLLLQQLPGYATYCMQVRFRLIPLIW